MCCGFDRLDPLLDFGAAHTRYRNFCAANALNRASRFHFAIVELTAPHPCMHGIISVMLFLANS